MHSNQLQRNLNRIPIIGIVLFGISFFVASQLYSGGSPLDMKSEGYRLTENYMCNLMNEFALDGNINTGRPLAILGFMALTLGLTPFFYQFSVFISRSNLWGKLIRYGGITSMVLLSFIWTAYHDEITIISSCFGLLAVFGIMLEVARHQSKVHWYTGLLCIILLLINNIIYYSSIGLHWLPIIQKVTTVIVLIWILSINIRIRKQMELDGIKR